MGKALPPSPPMNMANGHSLIALGSANRAIAGGYTPEKELVIFRGKSRGEAFDYLWLKATTTRDRVLLEMFNHVNNGYRVSLYREQYMQIMAVLPPEISKNIIFGATGVMSELGD